MQDNAMKFGVVGFLLGFGIMWIASMNAVNTNNAGMMNMMGMKMPAQKNETNQMGRTNQNMHSMDGMNMSMGDMTAALKNKTGDDFDQAFIETMIPHHQGAIDMANLAIQQAKHQEIKDLAAGIIEAQQKEINMMNEWMKIWGY